MPVDLAPVIAKPADLLPRYLANLAALYRRDAALALRLDGLPFAAAPKLEPARDGGLTAQVAADDGKPVYLHSRYQPLEEARKLIDGLQAIDNPTFLLQGLGLGHHVAELERRFDRPVVIVAEDDLGLLKAALCVHDFAAMIDAGRLILLPSAERCALHEKLERCNADVLLGLHYITPPQARRVHAAFHEALRTALMDFVSYARMQMITLLKTARVTFQNVAYNLPTYVGSPGVEGLKDRAAGCPAIVVAAGPSLARNIDQLAALRERAVIVSVQTVFKLLLSLGVRPHFVTSLDFHEVSAEFFRGADDVGDCVLVAEPKATWHVLDAYRGEKRVLHHRFADALLRDAAPPRGRLRPGTTVAHLAFYLAEHLGCDPIIFVGQDLAFTEGLFYLPGSPIERIWQPELNRFQTVEMKQWERIVRNRPILRRTRDVHGGDVYTDELLFTYIEQFQKDFATCGRRIIQASEGGVALEGTEAMTLRQAAERFCTRPLASGFLRQDAPANQAASPQRAASELEARLKELSRTREIASEMRGLLQRLEQLVERPAEFNRLVVRVDDLRTAIHEFDHVYQMVIDVSAQAELRRHQADRRLGRVEKETPETARRRLQRDRDFVSAFLEGCDFLQQVLPAALERIRRPPV